MASRKKTWAEKMAHPPQPEVSVLDKPYAGSAPGAKMLIPTPAIVKAYIESIPLSQTRTPTVMRTELAKQNSADMTCPLTAGIFTRIVAEAALDEMRSGEPFESITPFWRLVGPRTPLAKKLSCGPDFVRERREAEGLED
jgi:hypothetical protein